MRISDHFTLAEATKSQTALRLGIDNRPPDGILPALRLTAEAILEPARAHFAVPIVPSSWYRCRALNDAIGSKPTSQHVRGEAVDFEVPGVANVHLARWLVANLRDFDQIILEFWNPLDPAAGWVHASYSAAGNRQQVFRVGRGGTEWGLPT